MTVDYYGVLGCSLEMIDGKPVLIAPDETEQSPTDANGFESLPDGRKVHFLSQNEYSYILKQPPYLTVKFEKPAFRSSPRAVETPAPPEQEEPVQLVIYFHGVPCDLEEIDGRQALTAAPENGTDILTDLRFEPMRSGRWRRLLERNEIDFIRGCDPRVPIIIGEPPAHLLGMPAWTPEHPGRLTIPAAPTQNPESSGAGKMIVSVILMIGGLLSLGVMKNLHFSMLLFAGAIGSCALLRIRHPENKGGKALSVSYGVIMAILGVLFLIGLVMCMQYFYDCVTCQWQNCK